MTCTRSEHVRVLPGHATDEAATEVTRRRRLAGTGTATRRGHYGLPLQERGGRRRAHLGVSGDVLELPGRWTETAVVGEDGGRGGADGARLEFVHPVTQTCKGGAQERLGTRTQGAGSKTR